MKRKTISIILAAALSLSLVACTDMAPVDAGKALPETGEAKDQTEVSSSSSTVSDGEEPDAQTDKEKSSVSAGEISIDERIEAVGMAYDGVSEYADEITSPQQASYYLDLTPWGEVKKNEAYSSFTKYQSDLRKCFTQTDIYEPKEGVDFIISDHKIYEYDTADRDNIIWLIKKVKSAYEELEYGDFIYEEDRSDESLGLGGFISNAFDAVVGAVASSSKMEADAGAVYSEAAEFAADSYAAEDGGVYGIDDLQAYEEPDWNTEEYGHFMENRFMSASASPFSTFGLDTDTASYSNMRRMIYNGSHIPTDSIRTEEMMNYFKYDEIDGEGKFKVSAEISDTPWNKDTKLLKVGVQAEKADTKEIDSNIVFLIDTSGSMFDLDKLPLVQKAFLILLAQLDGNDRVSLVTYAGDDSVRFEGLTGDDKKRITDEILSLDAAGGTNGAAGIERAYSLAEESFIKGGNNRVILATDGDLNLGVTSESDLVDLISKKRDKGIFLSVLGVGEGNYKDSKMKALADNGNGNFSYIDCTMEAKRALEEDFEQLVYTVAKDSKMQIEFNPARVKGYRQIGYEMRQLKAEDFADDTKDGAEVGSGQHVTVLYEIVPVDSKMEIPGVSSKYGNSGAGSDSDEYLTVSIRYKEPDGDKSELIEVPVTDEDYRAKMSDDMSWAAGVAQVAMILRDSEFKGTSSYEEVLLRLKDDEDVMTDDYKAQFLYLVKALADGKSEAEVEE